jgi:hypothetical protein
MFIVFLRKEGSYIQIESLCDTQRDHKYSEGLLLFRCEGFGDLLLDYSVALAAHTGLPLCIERFWVAGAEAIRDSS